MAARRKARSGAVGSRGFWFVVVLLAATTVALRLWTSDRGQAFMVQRGITRHFLPELGTRLDVALARSFIDMGLLRGDLKARVVTEGKQRVREYVFTAPGHLTPTQCQLELRRAAAGVNGGIVRAEQRHEKGEQLVLLLGFGRAITHRVVIRPAPPPRVAQVRGHGPRIALIIDDLGNNMNDTARGFLDLQVPVTLAVLPDVSKSDEMFEAAAKHEIPTLLHLPMEPEGGQDPGKHAIRVGMSAEDIDDVVDHHLRRYKTFIGVNNHMGSRATADRTTMRGLMNALHKRDLVFVDSQTTPHSVGRETGRAAEVWCLANDLFLDDKAEPADVVSANLLRLAGLARKRGLAVGIAHPHPETLKALQALLPRLAAEGIEFVTIDALRPHGKTTAEAASTPPR